MCSSAAPADSDACWICGGAHLVLVKHSDLPAGLSAKEFRITNSAYGQTGDIFRCRECGFHQCSNMRAVLAYYEDMTDDSYESTRAERALQERALLLGIGDIKGGGRLLDVGAGSGILVEQALALGYDAVGVEPSKSLHQGAAALKLPVRLGILPHAEVCGPFDVVTCVDVIEHVPNPLDLLREIFTVMSDDGIAVIVTPDRKSLAAKLMGWRWWHYRIAHIGYFDQDTLARAISASGLTIIRIERPSWYFPADYIFDRLMRYFPKVLRLGAPRFLRKVVVPLNLRDSITVICRRTGSKNPG